MTRLWQNIFSEARTTAFRFVFALCFLPLGFTFVACSNEDPHIDQKFVNAYVEVRVAEQMYGAVSPMARMVRQETLRKYGYSKESFSQQADIILKDDLLWVPFQRQVVDRIDSLLDPEGFVKKKEAAVAAKKKKKPEGK